MNIRLRSRICLSVVLLSMLSNRFARTNMDVFIFTRHPGWYVMNTEEEDHNTDFQIQSLLNRLFIIVDSRFILKRKNTQNVCEQNFYFISNNRILKNPKYSIFAIF